MRNPIRHTTVVWLTAALIAMLMIGGLALSASSGRVQRLFTVNTPNQIAVAVVSPSHPLCEGPVSASQSIRAVAIWGASGSAGADLRVAVENARTRGELAAGLAVPSSLGAQVAHLSRSVGGGQDLRICLSTSHGTFSAYGGPAGDPRVAMTGPPTHQQFSLALLGVDRSLLDALPTAFARASLWRPSWVGSWTFWVLTAALLVSFGAGVAGVGAAAASDHEKDRWHRGSRS